MAYYVCPSPDLSVERVTASPSWAPARRVLEQAARRLHKSAALRRLALLAPEEHPLVTTCDIADASVVATHAALHRLGAPDGSGDWSRWGWEKIARIAWDDVTSTLHLVGQAPHLPQPVTLALPDPGPLVAVARERVTWTTPWATRVALRSSGTMRLVVRRHPITDRMDWFLYPDATIDKADAGVQQELEEVLARCRAETGL